MFVIKKSQLDALAASQLEQFRQRLRQHLATYFPSAAPSNEAGWEALLDVGLKASARYNLKTEEGITVYFNILLTLGHGFEQQDQYPWAAPLLSDMTLTEKEKIRRLIEHTEACLSSKPPGGIEP